MIRLLLLTLSILLVSCSHPEPITLNIADIVAGNSMKIRNDGNSIVTDIKIIAVLNNEPNNYELDTLKPLSATVTYLLSETGSTGNISGSYTTNNITSTILIRNIKKHTEIVINGNSWSVE